MKYTLFQSPEIRQCYNEIMFLDHLSQAAKENCGLNPDEPVLVGVSGGADSLALLVGLEQLGYKLIVAHVDHALRPESAADADFVGALANARDLPFVCERVDVAQYAEDHGQSLEEAAREVRYQYLFDQARRLNVQAVAVGHHADDQVETVLMHFLRGAGLPGLSGMAFRRVLADWDPVIPLVRPLLGLWREDIEAFVQDAGLTPQVDATNQELAYFRNRLRHTLIPELAAYNPQICQVLWRMSAVLGEEDLFLATLAEKAWILCFMEESQGLVQLSRPAFLGLATAMQRRVLRRAIDRLRPSLRNIGFEAVERGLAFAEAPHGSGEIDLVARLNLAVIGDRLLIKTWAADLPDGGNALLAFPGQALRLTPGNPVSLKYGWQIKMNYLADLPEDLPLKLAQLPPSEAWLDADQLELPLTVRAREAGERWRPLGMEGHTQSLQDFFVNERVPAHLREVWPLVCSGGEVAWVMGLRPSETFKVRARSRRVMRLRVVQKDSD